MYDFDEHQHQPLACKACSAPLEAAFSLDGPDAPPDGAYSLCVHCGEVSCFVVVDGVVVGLREPNFLELAIFNRDGGGRMAAFVARARTTQSGPFRQ